MGWVWLYGGCCVGDDPTTDDGGFCSTRMWCIGQGKCRGWGTIYEGKDLAQTLRQRLLDNAFRPFEQGNKLIVIGKKTDNYVIVYNQQVIGPEFNPIHMAHCYESVA